MSVISQSVLPAISNFKDLRKFLKTDLEYCVLLDFQLAELHNVVEEVKDQGKKVLVHIELIRGIANDEYGAIHLVQNYNIDGIITTKPQIIQIAKKRSVLAIERIFLKDTISLNRSIKILEKSTPDLVEILPATSKEVLLAVKERINLPFLCGGLIISSSQINECLESGAIAVTTSKSELWSYSHTS